MKKFNRHKHRIHSRRSTSDVRIGIGRIFIMAFDSATGGEPWSKIITNSNNPALHKLISTPTEISEVEDGAVSVIDMDISKERLEEMIAESEANDFLAKGE